MPPRPKAPAVDPGPLLLATWLGLLELLDRERVATVVGGTDERQHVRARLAAEIAATARDLHQPVPPGTPLTSPADYLRIAGAADQAGEEPASWPLDQATAGSAAVADVAELLRRTLPGVTPVTNSATGPVTRSVYLGHRVISAVAMGRDLLEPLLPDRSTLRFCVRLLASALAEQAPGRSVELRVPPHVAVQCVEGPRHTRGTPPNVVEVEPLAFLDLATGRRTWASGVRTGLIRASGERADLQPWLPLVGRAVDPA